MVNILLVEDNPHTIRAVREALNYAGHNTLLYTDGDSAINAIKSGLGYDIALLDLNIPGPNGDVVAKESKEVNPQVPCVYCSSIKLIETPEYNGKPLWDEWVADTEAKGLTGRKVLNEALRLIEKYK